MLVLDFHSFGKKDALEFPWLPKEVIIHTLRIREYFLHLGLTLYDYGAKTISRYMWLNPEHINLYIALHKLKGWAHLPSFFEKGKDSFVFGRSKTKVTQLLDGPLGLSRGQWSWVALEREQSQLCLLPLAALGEWREEEAWKSPWCQVTG